VRAVMMPSPYTAQISLDDAREMASILGVRYDVLDIKPAFDAYLVTLHDQFEGLPPDATEENIQARIRGNLLMALSNKFGSMVLTTGNKSEMTVGYCTLYGDMAGGFAVLKDVSKTWVYRLANYRNGLGRVIPERIITRPPSAELKPDQTDQDSLPPYDVLDGIMACYVESNLSIAEIVARGYAEDAAHAQSRPASRSYAATTLLISNMERSALPGSIGVARLSEIAFASAATSPQGTRHCGKAVNISRGPEGQSVLTVGVPQASASIRTLGRPSWSEQSTSRSAPAIQG